MVSFELNCTQVTSFFTLNKCCSVCLRRPCFCADRNTDLANSTTNICLQVSDDRLSNVFLFSHSCCCCDPNKKKLYCLAESCTSKLYFTLSAKKMMADRWKTTNGPLSPKIVWPEIIKLCLCNQLAYLYMISICFDAKLDRSIY